MEGMNIDAYVARLRSRLRDHPATHANLVAMSGRALSMSWISKFSRGCLSNPTVGSLKALDAALTAAERPPPA